MSDTQLEAGKYLIAALIFTVVGGLPFALVLYAILKHGLQQIFRSDEDE